MGPWGYSGPVSGSSPQARGAREVQPEQTPLHGLIPAGAGSTAQNEHRQGQAQAHPRRRGEHSSKRTPARSGPGSPPQARGARLGGYFSGYVGGLIPAGAGSTSAPPVLQTRKPAHPRRRGEHFQVPRVMWSRSGSSPQARGAPFNLRGELIQARLIPAGAGSTLRDQHILFCV
ncbi:Domain of uncharacterised function (DUF2825) [Dermatophilus congolensis]|uniref:Domain of uncharacterized function (DUF2825) n=1 Tax=Dermatophilus congolensis TaxID=1863 RepID=A0A239VIN1_9MICO|nr:Domain of uncharacterised function (DUF2825) [Dermatophilus congolensis]